jgi:hypothetical protein
LYSPAVVGCTAPVVPLSSRTYPFPARINCDGVDVLMCWNNVLLVTKVVTTCPVIMVSFSGGRFLGCG